MKFKSRLTLVKEKVEKINKCWHGEYLCSCGKTKIIQDYRVRTGKTKSCGCIILEGPRTSHKMTKTRMYAVWRMMKHRCSNPDAHNYRWYGARGIKVCKQWSESFVAFHDWAMANGYDPILTLDRENSNKDYKPSNCRWVTIKVNSTNTRGNIGDVKAKEIRAFLNKGMSPKDVALIFKISDASARDIKARRTYADI